MPPHADLPNTCRHRAPMLSTSSAPAVRDKDCTILFSRQRPQTHLSSVLPTRHSRRACLTSFSTIRQLDLRLQPVFSGKCPVQANQVSITENMLDAAREECNRLELRRWRLKEGEQTVGGHSSGARRRSVVTCWQRLSHYVISVPRLPNCSTCRT